MAAKFSQLETPKKRKVSIRKAVTLGLAAAALGALLTGAGWLSDWAKNLPQTQHTTVGEQKDAEKSGLSYKPDSIAVTSDSVTVILKQYLVDSHSVLLSFQVDGVEIPEGEHPMFKVNTFTFDGKQPGGSSGGSFEMGIYENDQGEAVYADGSPVELDSEGCWIPHYQNPDGSLVYGMHFQTSDDLRSYFGKEIRVELGGLVFSGNREDIPVSEGPWVFSWTLEGSSQTKYTAVNQEIGDTGVLLDSVQMSAINLQVDLTLPEVFEGYDTLEPFYLPVVGVRTRDGVIHEEISGGGTDHYVDKTTGHYQMVRAWNGILHPSDVNAILFFDTRSDKTITIELP